MALHLDPAEHPPDREERLSSKAARVELRPAERTARLATRSLACPACGMPIAIAEPVGFAEQIACAFCEGASPTRDFLCERGWPQVDVIARL